MSRVPEELAGFWRRFRDAVGGVDDARFLEAASFGDSPEMQDRLAALVLRGTKRATAGAVWAHETFGPRVPRPGDLSVVVDGAGRPLCVIETRTVEIVPFAEVTAGFAAAEGEGDGSLAWWREAHRRFFTRECERAGRTFSEDMLVACERFEIVWRPAGDEV